MRTFLFLALRTPKFTARLVSAAIRSPVTVVLDLEDALWDVFDPAHTLELKATGRETLVALALDHPELFAGHSIGVRVNPVAGAEADLDFAALARAAAMVPLACVVVPKVERPADVASARERVAGLGLAPEALVPIVETRTAMADADAILARARSAGVDWVVFGLYDFALDSGWWPFPDHRGEELWAVIQPFLARIEAAGMQYIDAPYAGIADEAGLALILERLERTCQREFGALTVGLGQARAASRFALGRRPEAARAGAMPVVLAPAAAVDALALAQRVIEVYNSRERADTSFTVDPETGNFIPPHVYLAARRYLREHAGV